MFKLYTQGTAYRYTEDNRVFYYKQQRRRLVSWASMSTEAMNFVDGCPQCRRISGRYEAATLQWFRVQGQLDVAQYLNDPETSAGIVAELAVIAKRRQTLREAAERHIARAHATRTAGSR